MPRRLPASLQPGGDSALWRLPPADISSSTAADQTTKAVCRLDQLRPRQNGYALPWSGTSGNCQCVTPMSRTAVPTARPGRLCLRLELRDPSSSQRRCPVPVKRGFGGMRKRPPACHWLLFPGQPAVGRRARCSEGPTRHSRDDGPLSGDDPRHHSLPAAGRPRVPTDQPGILAGARPPLEPLLYSTCGTLRRRPSIGQADRTLVKSNIVESKIRLQQK